MRTENVAKGCIFSLFVFVIGAILIGWGLNIYKLTRCDFKQPYKAEVLRGIGVIPPVGAVIGWYDIKDN